MFSIKLIKEFTLNVFNQSHSFFDALHDALEVVARGLDVHGDGFLLGIWAAADHHDVR